MSNREGRRVFKSGILRAIPISVMVLILALISCGVSWGQDSSSDYDFWISQDLLHDILAQKSVLYTLSVDLGGRSAMHPLGPKSNDDCEMHLAGYPTQQNALGPDGVVIEPPFVCIEANQPPSQTTWSTYFDKVALKEGVNCKATGFPRLLDEHLTGKASESNPHHFFELHPLTKLQCGGNSVDFTSFFQYHDGAGEISPSSAAKCFNITTKVRHRITHQDNKSLPRYEFQVSRPSNCGNFISFEMSIFSEWIRSVDSSDATEAKGHSAIARVKPANSDEFKTLKIYTLPGTPEDAELRQWGQEWRDFQSGKIPQASPHHGAYYFGVTTIDFYSVGKAIRDINRKYTYPKKWTNVPYPLAMVVYGSKEDPNPDEDPGEDFD